MNWLFKQVYFDNSKLLKSAIKRNKRLNALKWLQLDKNLRSKNQIILVLVTVLCSKLTDPNAATCVSSEHNVGCIDRESMETGVNLTDSGFEARLTPQKARTSTTQLSSR